MKDTYLFWIGFLLMVMGIVMSIVFAIGAFIILTMIGLVLATLSLFGIDNLVAHKKYKAKKGS